MPEFSLGTSTYVDTVEPNPINEITASPKTVAIDTLGHVELWSFAWVRAFFVRQAAPPEHHPSSEQEGSIKRDARHCANLQLASTDMCVTNVHALQKLYRSEELKRGAINTSMLRVCFALCRKRLLVASAIYLLSILAGFIGVTVFLFYYMSIVNLRFEEYLAHKDKVINKFPLKTKHGDVLNISTQYTMELDSMDRTHGNYYLMCGFLMMAVAMYLLRSVFNSMVLRTAVALRSACAGVVYAACHATSPQSYVASYQVMLFCADDGDAIMEMVMKGSPIIAQTMGIAMCMGYGFFTMGFYMIWVLLGLTILMIITFLFAMASASFYSKSLSFQKQKMAAADEFCQPSTANDADPIKHNEAYKKRFSLATSGQFWALFRSDALKPSATGSLTVTLLIGLLALIGLYTRYYKLEQIEHAIVLSFLFMFLLQTIMSEWSDAAVAMLRGIAAINKLKPFLTQAPSAKPMNAPKDALLKISLRNATFKRQESHRAPLEIDTEQSHIADTSRLLNIKSFDVEQNSIVGVTGKDALEIKSLILALLGHIPLQTGDYHQSAALSFYPETPYIMADCSIRQNVVFASNEYEPFIEQRYTDALDTVRIHINPGMDSVPLSNYALDQQLKQRISLARALYKQSDYTILLENPLNGVDSQSEISDIFSVVAAKLLVQRKTVIVVSQDENVLRHCQRIFLLTDGALVETFENATLYHKILQDYRNKREVVRNENLTNNLQTTLTISTEDLVIKVLPAAPEVPSMFTPFQTFLLILFQLFNIIFQVSFPLAELRMCHSLRIYFFDIIVVITLVLGILIIVTNSLVMYYVYRTVRRNAKRMQRSIFQQLLHSSRKALTESQMVATFNTLLETNLKAFTVKSKLIQCWISLLFVIVSLAPFNTWCTVFCLMCVVQYFGLLSMFRNTMENAGHVKSANRLKLFEHIHNDIKGRTVLQSFGHIRESTNRIFDLIDAHSAAIYLNQSIVYSVQFIFTLFQVLNLPMLIFALDQMIIRSESEKIHYVIVPYLFFLMTNNVYALLETRLTKILGDQTLQQSQNFKMATEDISTLQFV